MSKASVVVAIGQQDHAGQIASPEIPSQRRERGAGARGLSIRDQAHRTARLIEQPQGPQRLAERIGSYHPALAPLCQPRAGSG